MMDTLTNLQPYLQFANERAQALKQAIDTLETQHRQDEANLCKVKLNIVEVLLTIADVYSKNTADWEKFAQLYERRFEMLIEPWHKRYQTAQEHGDTVTMVIEEAKIATATQLRAAFLHVKGVL